MRAGFVTRKPFLSTAWLWPLLLVSASLFFSLGIACAVPLAAFAALGALTLPPRAAYGLIGAVWLTNQIVGYLFLSYPLDFSTLAWGFALAAAGLCAAFAALEVRSRLSTAGILGTGAVFLSAFAAYEGLLFALTLAFEDDLSTYEPAVVGRVLAINATAFAIFLLLHRFASALGTGTESGGEITLCRAQQRPFSI